MNELEIEIGDTVRIADSSQYYMYQTKDNPRCEGVYTKTYTDSIEDHPYRVEWENGRGNSYNLHDLTLIKKGEKEMKEFTKSDLIKLAQTKTVVVKQRNGDMKLVLGVNLCGNNYKWSRIVEFESDLTNTDWKKFDIVAVYKTSEGSSLTAYLEGHYLTKLWERTEQTAVQKEVEILQAQVKAVQKQITKLQEKL
jgi:hypothetical protein